MPVSIEAFGLVPERSKRVINSAAAVSAENRQGKSQGARAVSLQLAGGRMNEVNGEQRASSLEPGPVKDEALASALESEELVRLR
ncbi:hypothetical protein A4R35_14590 [Thermogemmatispora tikiterensis]|uniref:Uncharacterized protein n=1 Tax=Thermogemmatispora tikiterensis TaxID=1825093 RepID=A0A328VH51_9CHLR|nr:hypothetical protein A4R35_14590 [Thermogemmatispora tikiterensis]